MSLIRIIFSFILISFSVLSAGELSGLVYDAEDGSSISNAKIIAIAYTADGDSIKYISQSAENGEYAISDMAPYSYLVRCEYPDYMRMEVNAFVVSENAGLKLDFALKRIHYPYYDTKVSGFVFSTPETLPGIIPLPGAMITLYNDVVKYETKSNNDGGYSFHNIKPGEYSLSARAPQHQPYEYDEVISVKEGNYVVIRDIHLIPLPHPETSTVYGKIMEANNDRPVYPAYVTLIPLYYFLTDGPVPVDPEIYAVVNNPDGNYVVENIPSGKYMMICSARTHKWQRLEVISLDDQKVKADFFLEALDPNQNNLITGTIYGSNDQRRGIPLVDVYLTYVNPPYEMPPEVLYHSLSDGFGNYQFYDLPAGEVALQLSKFGYEPLLDTLKVEDDTWLIDQDYFMRLINNNNPIVLKGYVYDSKSDNKTVYPARIQLYTINSAGEQIRYGTVNNPDGSYKISGIRPGTYTVVCSAMGYEKEVVPNLILSELEHTLDFYLDPRPSSEYGLVTGRVYFDRLNQPVAGAVISFLPKYTDLTQYDAAYHTRTGNDGTYEVKLPEDEYIVSCQFWNQEGWYFYQEYYDNVHSLADATPIKVQGGTTVGGIDFGIPYPAVVSSVTIKGHVSDSDGNALGQALVNVRPFDLAVQAYGAADNVYQTKTDDQGNYVIEIDLYWITIPTPVLGFIVSADKEGYATEFYKEKKTPFEADILWAYSDTTFSPIDFTLDQLNQIHAITGTVNNESGNPIANAFVIGMHASSGEVAFTVTGNTGSYRLGGLKRGYYFLLFVASGYLPEFYDDARVWEDATPVWVDGIVSDIDAELMQMPVLSDAINGFVSGRIVDDEGNPVSGAIVTMQLRDGPVRAYCLSDQDGMFEILWEDEGEYLINISKVNYSSQSVWVSVSSDESSTNSMLVTLESTFTGLPDEESGPGENPLPVSYRLYGNYPNPFNPITHIKFDLPAQQQVSLIVYSILGHRVRELLSGKMSAGSHSVTWDGTDQRGLTVASGIYFYVLQTPTTRLVGKMILQK
jgi:hypothetical protein